MDHLQFHVGALVVSASLAVTSNATAQSEKLGGIPAVDAWADLAAIKGDIAASVYVREPDRRGIVTFVPNAELPSWAKAPPPPKPPLLGSAWSPDVPGLCQTDLGGTGKWIYRWTGPVEFRRFGATLNYQAGGAPDPRDERDALTRIAWLADIVASAPPEDPPAVFDQIYVGPGQYNGNLRFRVSSPLRILGAGPDQTVFFGSGIASHEVFGLDSSLTLENMRIVDQGRLVYLNPDARDGLDLRLTLEDVEFECDTPGIAAISSRPSGPFENSSFRLEMSDCRFRLSSTMTHVDARLGMTGFVRSCVFEGGRHGIVTIPSGNPGSVSGPANRYFPDFRVTDCEFGDLTYKLSGDSYHLQVAGERWVISGCRFGGVAGTGNGSSGAAGNIYSNLRDSHIIGCTFASNATFGVFFKGSTRPGSITPVPTNGEGWGNSVIGCTFEYRPAPSASGTRHVAHVYMNVREQRFIGCSFRDYDGYAMVLNQQGVQGVADGGDILIQGCDFTSSNSPGAILFQKGGRAIKVRECTFADIDGPPDGVRQGLLVFDPGSGVPQEFTDVTVEGCTFRDNTCPVIYVYAGSTALNRFRFAGNVVDQPSTYAIQAGTSTTLAGVALERNHFDVNRVLAISPMVTVSDLVLERNYFEMSSSGWPVLPASSVKRSVDNTWVGVPPPSNAIRGIQRGTVIEGDLALTALDTITVEPGVRLKRLASNGGNIVIPMGPGSFDGQRVTLLGDSTLNSVTIQDSGFAALGANRLLEENDSLELVWNDTKQVWCQIAYNHN